MLTSELFCAVDTFVRELPSPRMRAGMERWMVEYISANQHFTVEQASTIAMTMARRCENCLMDDAQARADMTGVEVRTALDWAMRGSYPLGGVEPILLPSANNGTLEAYPAYDVSAPEWDDELPTMVGAEAAPRVAHTRSACGVANVVAPEAMAYLPNLQCIGIAVTVGQDLDDETLVRTIHHENTATATQQRDAPVAVELRINQDCTHDMTVHVLRAVANVFYCALAQCDAANTGREDETAHPLELGLIAYMVGRRLGIIAMDLEVLDDSWVDDFLYVFPDIPADSVVNWKLVGLATMAMEDALRGHAC